jgi:hypothetical protein
MHLVFNSLGNIQGIRKTLCGESVAATTDTTEDDGLNEEVRIMTPATVNEILEAVVKDDKDTLCNKCLAEFFDNVLPLKWKLMNYETVAAAVATTTKKSSRAKRRRRRRSTSHPDLLTSEKVPFHSGA